MIPLFVAPVVGLWTLYNAFLADHSQARRYQNFEKFKPGLANIVRQTDHLDRLRKTDMGKFVDGIISQLDRQKSDHVHYHRALQHTDFHMSKIKEDIAGMSLVLQVIFFITFMVFLLASAAFVTNHRLLRQAQTIAAQRTGNDRSEVKKEKLDARLKEQGQLQKAIEALLSAHHERLTPQLIKIATQHQELNKTLSAFTTEQANQHKSLQDPVRNKQEEFHKSLVAFKTDQATVHKENHDFLSAQCRELSTQLKSTQDELMSQQKTFQEQLLEQRKEHEAVVSRQREELSAHLVASKTGQATQAKEFQEFLSSQRKFSISELAALRQEHVKQSKEFQDLLTAERKEFAELSTQYAAAKQEHADQLRELRELMSKVAAPPLMFNKATKNLDIPQDPFHEEHTGAAFQDASSTHRGIATQALDQPKEANTAAIQEHAVPSSSTVRSATNNVPADSKWASAPAVPDTAMTATTSLSGSITSNSVSRCSTCGRPGHIPEECWKNHICCRCGTIGHLEYMCRSRLQQCPTCYKVGHLEDMCPRTNTEAGYSPERFWKKTIPRGILTKYSEQPPEV